jgi:hypothetical protein
VHGRERLAIHRPGEQNLWTTRLVERDRATEALDRVGLRADVGAPEADVRRAAQRTGEREHIAERDAGPGRRAGRARTPRRLARNIADGDQTRAPVAGALQRRRLSACPERLAQRRQREVQFALDEPTNAQPPRGGVDLRHRTVPAHVERVCGGQRTLGQGGARRLCVERLLLVHDQIRALAVAAHATSPGVRTARAASRTTSRAEPRSINDMRR